MAATITTIKTGLTGASNFEINGARKIARNSLGHIYVVYWRTDGVKKQVYVSVSTNGGANWTETQLSADQTKDKVNPTIAIDSADDVYVTWTYDASGTSKIECIKYDYSAGTWGSMVTVVSASGVDYPCLAVASNDHVHCVFWRSYGGGGVYHKETANGNSTWSAAHTIRYNEILSYDETTFCIDSNDKLHVIFSISYYKSYYSTSSDDGVNWSANPVLMSNASYSATSNSICAGSNGEVYAVWSESRIYREIYFNYTVSGVWQSAVKIANGNYSSRYCNISIDKDNHIYVAFSGYLLGQTSYYQIGWLVSTNGGGSWSAITFETSGNYIKYYPHLISAYHPIVSSLRPNVAYTGFMLAYLDANNWDLKLMCSSDLAWPSAAPVIQEFTDSGEGSDTYKNADGIYKFVDSGVGIDLIKTIGAIMKFLDTGHGAETYALYSLKSFTDVGAGVDSYSKIIIAIIVDSGIGVDSFKASKVVVYPDIAYGIDKFLINKIVNLVDSGLGDDDFLLKADMLFKDYGVGIEVFKVSYPYPRNLRRKIIIIRGLK